LFDRIAILVIKELIQFARDRLLTAFILLFPVVQLVLLAQATGRGIVNQLVVVVDQDNSRVSRELIARLDNTEELKVHKRLTNLALADALLDVGDVRALVVIPAGFERELFRSGGSPQLQIVTDGSNNLVASTVQNTAEGVIGDYLQDMAAFRGQPIIDPIGLRISIRYNPALNSRQHTIPAQVGFIVYQVTLAVSSLALTRERELGTLEQLLVTPLRRFELVVGKALPALAIGLVNFGIMLLVTHYGFQIPLRGSAALLVMLSLIFIAGEIGWGVIISTLSRTQQQAILLVFILAMLDMAFSGYLVPVDNMPWLMQKFSYLSLLQHYLIILRAVMLKGAGLEGLWIQALMMIVLGVGVFFVAIRRVSRSLE